MAPIKPKHQTDIIMKALRSRKTNAEALALVKKAFPKATLGAASVNWFRNRMREAGEKIPTNAELTRGK